MTFDPIDWSDQAERPPNREPAALAARERNCVRFAGSWHYCDRDKQATLSQIEIMITAHPAQIRVRRYDGVPECDVIVFFRDRELTLRCRDYDQAVKWARIECKSYKVADGFTVER